ncbi:Protein GET1 [Smittium mucronatum]|uniref:Protein GET1 n=1 Tax=Smittium mucronatum TaxID=133383 RepID=A0A1R0H7B6_9FUNG|nr:Protein GET1 [Smittium mucronatum]
MLFATLIFLFELFSAFVSTIGYSEVAQRLHNLYYIGQPLSAERTKLAAEVKALRSELRLVSSVDEFSKWAKLKRKLDATSKKYDALNSDLGVQKTSFSIRANIGLRAFFYASRFIILTYYYRSPVFYLPTKWVFPFGYFLSLPASPASSLSPAIWVYVCNRVCSKVIQSVKDSFSSRVDSRQLN